MENPISAKAALLQALTAGPGFGLDLIERVRDRTNGIVSLHQGSVYPALRDLEGEGLVVSSLGEVIPERGGRPRRNFQITAQGRKMAVQQRKGILALFTP